LPILAPLLVFLIAFLCVCGLAGLVAFVLTWRKLALFLKARRERNLLALDHYHSRLSLVVSELLSRANEIDQQSKYLPQEMEAEWSASFVKLGNALVVMGDALVIIKERVAEKNVKSARELTLILCREATLVSKRLLEFERRLLQAERLQLEQIKAVQQTIKEAETEMAIQSILDADLGGTLDRSTTGDGGNPAGSGNSALETTEKKISQKKGKRRAEGSSD